MNREIKILFADDEKIYSCAILDSNFGQKYNFDFVYTIEEAIDHLEYNDFNYDVMVVDLRFKVENLAGLKIFRYLREKSIEIPSIIITAYANEKNLKECVKERPYAFLDKPFDCGTLKKKIGEVLKKANKDKKVRNPYLPTVRRMFDKIRGQAKVDLLIEGLESLRPEEYETIVSELPMIQTVIQEEQLYKDYKEFDDSWKKTGKIPLKLLERANLSIEYQTKKLASGKKKVYGPFVYMRWMDDGKQGQHYVGKLEKLTNPDVIERLYERYQNEEHIRKLDRVNALPLLYKKYCQPKKR